jgi:mercuric ion binding protein
MKNIIIIQIIAAALFISMGFVNHTQPKKVDTVTFKVHGCCGQCKDRIEEAMDIKGVRFAEWNKETEMLTVSYRTKKLTLEDLHRKVASVGHDTELFKADDKVYSELPDCCQYRGGKKCTH